MSKIEVEFGVCIHRQEYILYTNGVEPGEKGPNVSVQKDKGMRSLETMQAGLMMVDEMVLLVDNAR